MLFEWLIKTEDICRFINLFNNELGSRIINLKENLSKVNIEHSLIIEYIIKEIQCPYSIINNSHRLSNEDT